MQPELVRQAMSGDHEAFAELTRSSTGSLYGLARLILHDSDRAEDATQEALVSAWRHLSSLRDPERFEAWLRRMLVRACYAEAKREKRRHTIEAQVEPVARTAPDPGIELADRDELGRLFMHLKPEQRALVVLHYYLGLELKEIGETLGMPSGTVKSKLSRTIAEMRATADADARVPVTAGRTA